MGARESARSRAPIYNKMKAIRGDNPRTTNQRVYLMPVVPPPPPEKPPTWNSFPSLSLSLSILLHRCLSSICSSLPLGFSPVCHLLSLSFPLIHSVYRASSLSSPCYHLPLCSRSHVITLLLSDMSLCYRHNQPALSSLFALLFSRIHSFGRPLRRTSPPRYLQRVVRSRIPAI